MQRGNESGILEKAIYFAAIVLVVKLFFLQVLTPEYKLKAHDNVVKKVTVYPSRGLIIDRNGKVMVYNGAVYDILVQWNITKNLDTLRLCELLNTDVDFVRKKLDEIKRTTPNKPTPFIKLLDPQTFARFQEHLFEFPSFTFQVRTVRRYPYHSGAAVFGYLSEVTENNIQQSGGYYELGDYMGTTGIEQYYDSLLRGEKGYTFQVVDVKNTYKGKYKNGKEDKIPIAGWDMYAGLDAELQEYGEKLMKGKVGGIIAIEPATGEVLAYVSSPGYDPNLLTGRYRRYNFNVLFKNYYKPLLNRPIQAMYPPGSTFKAAAALVTLQSHTHEEKWHWFCPGGYRVGSHTVNCHGSHGIPDVQTALQYSCNSYFCKVYNDFIMDSIYKTPAIGYQKWWDMMSVFGYGKKLGIDLKGEKRGNLPSVKYYNKIFGEGKWRAATVISNSIGQGEVLATPLQIANAMAIIANKGYYITPKISRYFVKDKKIRKPKTQKIQTGIDTVYYRYVTDGLEKVVQAGTARIAQIPGISFCGKTGTAQNPHGKDHSIFSGFAPKDNPKIAIAVFVENAGFGATYAAPIASLMVEKYLNDTIAKKRIPLQERMFKARIINEEMEVGVPKTPEQIRQDSLAKEKIRKDRIKFVEDSIKTAKEKDKNKTTPKTKKDSVLFFKKEDDIYQE
ncbi:MAG TPA: penicillin-binding protein 2 [Chitinophagales bacterium]|nr:penicillin-binding protein 2 [Chitinophagales bacterium]HMW12680.1 penicillin-binding protein 2 [Chitinophagales bacterium]HMX60261.1 penicillin-binding protein 2 [Chitinophagales bacterium]HMY24443.1 penicillin-binding protein 2 [Chitinophagales bacterium]HMZ34392.1 penicillin-binding protein 2 [Chitinophagales bacterium]